MPEIRPHDLNTNPLVPRIVGPISLDTETSGLFVDDGARMSTTSVAWVDHLGDWEQQFGLGQWIWAGGIFTIRYENVYEDDGHNDHQMCVVSMAWPFDQGVAGTGKAEDDGQQTLWPEADNQTRQQFDALVEWLKRVGRKNGLVMHHMKFDVHIMSAGVRRWRGVGVDLLDLTIWDTQNGNSLLYPTEVLVRGDKGMWVPSTSLKPTAKWLWGDAEGDEQKIIQDYLRRKKLPKGRWDLMPWDIIAKYADDDARKTIRLYYRQLMDIKTRTSNNQDWTDLEAAMTRRLAVSRMLTRIERRAMPFDVPGSLKASKMVQAKIRELEDALPFQPPTLAMAKHYWFGEGESKGVMSLGLDPMATTTKGAVSLTAEIVDRLAALDVQGAKTWKSLVKLQTADSRWYAGYARMCGPDGRLRAGFRQNGTRSGRFSIERIQLQAIPHDYRLEGYPELVGIPTPRALIGQGVPDGWAMWELDLANAEARVAALLGKCDPMLDLIKSGADLHGVTTKALFKIDEKSREWGQMRNVGKRGNFSFIFGVGWETFQETIRRETGIELSEKECRRIVKAWNALYPQYQHTIQHHSRVVEARIKRHGRGWVDLVNGERRWFQKGEETHKAFNQRVQGNLAQFGMDWWLDVEQDTMRALGDEYVDGVGKVGVVMLIHDSTVLLVPDDEVGRGIVQYAKDAGALRWTHWFKGVPGGVDAKRWGAHD